MCPVENWALHLVPLLIGKDKAAYVAMEIEDPLVYDLVKRAILDKYKIR